MKFDELFLGTSRFHEIWENGSYLHLDDKASHEKEFGISNL
jgi:hypothetical protein